MICTYTTPVYTRIQALKTPRRNVRIYSKKENFDNVLKTNKRMRYAIRKHKVSRKMKNDSNKIILEELVSILDMMDDVMNVLKDDEVVHNMDDVIGLYTLNCGEIPDEEFIDYINERDWP